MFYMIEMVTFEIDLDEDLVEWTNEKGFDVYELLPELLEQFKEDYSEYEDLRDEVDEFSEEEEDLKLQLNEVQSWMALKKSKARSYQTKWRGLMPIIPMTRQERKLSLRKIIEHIQEYDEDDTAHMVDIVKLAEQNGLDEDDVAEQLKDLLREGEIEQKGKFQYSINE